MTLTNSLYPLLRRALFSLEPERAHELTLAGLQKIHACKLARKLFLPAPAKGRPTQIMGLSLANPVGLAAGLDKNGAHIDALASLGFGFIEVGTVTPKAQPGNPKPRLFRLTQSECLINRMGFNNDGLERFIQNVAASNWRSQGGILGLNIGKNAATAIEDALDDYLVGLERVYPHADYISINISSPNTANLRSLQGPEALQALLGALQAKRNALADQYQCRKPLALKIAPDLQAAEVAVIADLVNSNGIDGVIATNTTLARAAVQGQRHADEAGGLSGAPVHAMSLEVIAQLRARLAAHVDIIGVGGVMEAKQAQEKIQAGARAVQLYTGLIYRGPALVKECVEALA